VELFLDSGIRLEELSSLQLPNIDIVNCRLKVFGKGGKERFAYFSQVTVIKMLLLI
jgi:site-specific recombinase XerC